MDLREAEQYIESLPAFKFAGEQRVLGDDCPASIHPDAASNLDCRVVDEVTSPDQAIQNADS